jgi:hypothetical protein
LKYKLKIEKDQNLLLLNEKCNKLFHENEIVNILEKKQLSCKDFEIYNSLYKIKDVIELISEDYKKILIKELRTTNLKYLENY